MKKVDKDINHKIERGKVAKNDVKEIVNEDLPIYEKITG